MSAGICGDYLLDDIGDVLESYDRILVTAPDGLKPLYRCFLEKYRDVLDGKHVFFSSEPYYGSCIFPVSEITALKPDLVIHIGHNEYPFTSYELGVRIAYVHAYYTRRPGDDELEIIAYRLKDSNLQRIGLLCSIQYLRLLPVIKEYLEKWGFEVYLPEPMPEKMLPGQILGCEVSAAQRVASSVDGYLVVTGGWFHPLGIYLATRKKVLVYDPHKMTVTDYTRKAYSILAKRYYVVEAIRNSNYRRVGIITGTSIGQYRPTIVELLVRKSLEKGLEPYLISSLYLDINRMAAIDNGLRLDYYVVTSCPRLAIDDLSDFYKPVITAGEYLMILDDKKEYVFP